MRDNSAGNAARGQVRAAVERCRIEGDGGADGVGVRVLSGTHVAVADSLVADDGLGVDVRVEAGSPLAALTITRSTVTDNRIGVYADSTGQVHPGGLDRVTRRHRPLHAERGHRLQRRQQRRARELQRHLAAAPSTSRPTAAPDDPGPGR